MSLLTVTNWDFFFFLTKDSNSQRHVPKLDGLWFVCLGRRRDWWWGVERKGCMDGDRQREREDG